MSADSTSWMRRAIELSKFGHPAPNPHVGCVIVKDREVVGEGYHDHAGGPHAEVVALAQAAERARGATVYVTLEPCNHHGRTPPCTEALIQAGVRRVEVAVREPHALAAGGLETLASAGIVVGSGILAEEARAANIVWLLAMERRRPYVTIKSAVTLDGFMARSDGSSKWITGEASRTLARRMRADMGAVVVGRSTIVRDDPLLTARDPAVVNEPVRIVLDPNGALTGSEQVFGQPGSVHWIVASGQKRDPRQTECPFDGTFDLQILLGLLFEQGVTGLLVEGGAETIRRFLGAGYADRLTLFVAPVTFLDGTRFPFEAIGTRDLVLLRAFESEADVVMEYACDFS